MSCTFEIQKHELRLYKPAKTSRNTFVNRVVHYLHLYDDQGNKGIGECSTLLGLSPDDHPDYVLALTRFAQQWTEGAAIEELDLEEWPSIAFGLETAILQLASEGRDILFNTPFSKGEKPVPINGLVWMNEIEAMETEARQKLHQGFQCMKFKVGALDFEDELAMLRRLRNDFPDVVFRLDANGAFGEKDVFNKLESLSKLGIHSIEQPVKPGQLSLMHQVCSEAIIPVALDEELIGKNAVEEGKYLLEFIKPHYIILKPSLLGGLQRSEQWISVAESLGIGWWVTSALESNIGLRAIAQWTSSLPYQGHQGLGTGSLYENNIHTGLMVKGEELWHRPFEA